MAKLQGALPIFVEPMAARAVELLPEGPQWLYELKLDGYRALVLKNGDAVRILSRRHNDLTRSYPAIVSAALRLKARLATLDGEIVAIDSTGRPSFQALQHRSKHDARIVYYAFDLLHLAGRDMTGLALERRRARLPAVLDQSGILFSQELPGAARKVIDAVRKLQLEGIVAKRRDSPYESGERSGAWVKLKLDQQQEFVIGGFRPSGQSVNALLAGYYEGRHLRFAAKVKTGLTAYARSELFRKLLPLTREQCPFVNLPTGRSRWGGGVTPDEMHEMRWVRPRLVIQVRFVEWTADGLLRHAAYLGLRDDKKVRDVVREVPQQAIAYRLKSNE